MLAEKLIASLRDRVQRFQLGDPAALLDPRALAEAHRLDEIDPGQIFLTATAYALRCLGLHASGVRPGLEDLDRSIAALRAHPDRDHANAVLSDVLYALYAITTDPALLHEIIELTSALVGLVSPGMPQFAGLLERLSEAYYFRAQLNDDVTDLDEAVRLGEHAVATAPFGHQIQLLALMQTCLALQSRYEWLGQRNDLEVLIEYCRFAAGRIPTGDPVHAAVTSVLGNALRNRYLHGDRDVADLQTAVEIGRTAAANAPEGPFHSLCVANYAASLILRYAASADLSDLDEAIELSQGVNVPDDPNRGMILTNLSGALTARFRATNNAADLFAAVQAARDAVALPVNPNKGLTQAAASAALLALYLHESDPDVLAEAETAARAALAITADGHPQRNVRLHLLASILQLQALRAKSLPDLNEAVRLEREATSARSLDVAGQYLALAGLGQMLALRSVINKRPDDEAEGMQLLDEALALTEPGHLHRSLLQDIVARVRAATADPPPEPGPATPEDDWSRVRDIVRSGVFVEIAALHDDADSPDKLGNLSIAYVASYSHTRARADIDEAVRLAQAAVAATKDGDKGMPGRLANLAAALHTRFVDWQNPGDIRAAAQAAQESVDSLRGRSDSGTAFELHSLSVVLTAAFGHTHSRADIDRAVSTERAALEVLPEDDPIRTVLLAALSGALVDRFHAYDRLEDLVEAITTATQAVRAAKRKVDQARSLTALSRARRAGYERTGRDEDGEQMVTTARAAVAIDDTPAHLTVLARALRDYFQRGGELAELDEAIELMRRALAATPTNDALRPRRVLDLGGTLYNRYHHLGREDDLNESIRLITEAVPAGISASYLATLANALCDRFALSGSDQDLDDAVAHARQAVRMKRAPMVCHNALAGALGARFKHRADPADIEEAIQVLRREISALPAESRGARQLRSNLAATLYIRHEHAPTTADIAEIVTLLRASLAATPADDAGFGQQLANYATALRSRFKHDGTPIELADIDMAIAGLKTPATTATARYWAEAARYWGRAAADMGDAERATAAYAAAVRLLPQLAWYGLDRPAREKRLATFSGLSSEAAGWAISANRPEQAVELLEQGRAVLWNQILRSRVDLAPLREAEPGLAARLDDTRYRIEHAKLDTDRRRLAGEWESLLTEVRAQPGFENFLLPLTFQELSAAADGGPVIIVNVARHRCDALVVRPGSIQVVTLPDLTWTTVWEQALLFLALLQNPETSPEQMREGVRRMLEWLGHTMTTPILAAVGPAGRVWWCPTGILSLLPLHAAGDALDRVISSYTPTLTALLQARAKPAPTERLRGVAVGQPYMPGQPPLVGVAEEVERIAQSMTFNTGLLGPRATREEALSALVRHHWAHFACHGTQDINDPSQGALAMHDGMLTVFDLTAEQFRHAEFAYLSACNTATGGHIDLNDEAINLAAALHLAGYRHVVGTLWRISDDLAPDVADQFYQHVQQDPSRSAEALHHAVNEVRRQHPDRVDLWPFYIHIGP